MAQVKINGVALSPQPASSQWNIPTTGNKLNATNNVGAFASFVISAPPLKDQTYNWADFENIELASIETYPPSTNPEGTYQVYNSGVVSRKIQSYSQPQNRTVESISMEILVAL